MFLREHNGGAVQLLDRHPGMNDEQIFQRTRKIVIAEWQNIVYGEYLPMILGTSVMKSMGLELSETSAYNPGMDPSIRNSFATASYR